MLLKNYLESVEASVLRVAEPLAAPKKSPSAGFLGVGFDAKWESNSIFNSLLGL
jgi:hypothetical protein